MTPPSLVWFRRDLRLADQPALATAAAAGPVLGVYVFDEESAGVRPIGGAARWWLHASLAALRDDLRARGGDLVLLSGDSAEQLGALAAAVGADAVHATEQSEPWWPGIEARVPRLRLHAGSTLAPPGVLATASGAPFQIFTPFWRALQAYGPPPAPQPAPAALRFAAMPEGAGLKRWRLPDEEPHWAGGFSSWRPGEAGAWQAMRAFRPRLAGYAARRDFPGEPGTSRLSPHLHFGEISAAAAWHAARDAAGPAADPWLRQLAWRDFGREMLRQHPDSADAPHRAAFRAMPWTDVETPEGRRLLRAWQRGQTGYPLVDAGMRELWATGWMHNRVRMVAASFLTKHLMIDWRQGERWFWDTLVDADLANNAMGWQWVMGSGVDSAPYYRIFAPIAQSERFAGGAYIRRWVPELGGLGDDVVHGPFAGEGLFAERLNGYPPPLVDHAMARARALAAFEALKARV